MPKRSCGFVTLRTGGLRQKGRNWTGRHRTLQIAKWVPCIQETHLKIFMLCFWAWPQSLL
jgi:hypothetical protein